MYFQLGPARMEQNEVECLGYFRRRNTSARGGQATETKSLQIIIDQTRTGVQANSNRFRAIDRYVEIDQCGFLDDNFQQTPIWLSAAGSLSGVRILNPASWTPRSPVEFATHLSIFMGFEAEYPVTGADELLDYQESILFEDEGDVRTVGVETDTGEVEHFVTCLHPMRYLTQTGFCIARSTYPLPNEPMLTDVPLIARAKGKTTPTKVGEGWIGYRVDWRYTFLVKADGNWFPRLR